MKRSTKLLPPSKQRLPRLQFLKKQSPQKYCWGQARLSSLVNKQVAPVYVWSAKSHINKTIVIKVYSKNLNYKIKENLCLQSLSNI